MTYPLNYKNDKTPSLDFYAMSGLFVLTWNRLYLFFVFTIQKANYVFVDQRLNILLAVLDFKFIGITLEGNFLQYYPLILRKNLKKMIV